MEATLFDTYVVACFTASIFTHAFDFLGCRRVIILATASREPVAVAPRRLQHIAAAAGA